MYNVLLLLLLYNVQTHNVHKPSQLTRGVSQCGGKDPFSKVLAMSITSKTASWLQDAERLYASQLRPRVGSNSGSTWCQDEERRVPPYDALATVSLDAMWRWTRSVRRTSELMQYALKVSPRIFIAGLLHQNCNIARGWAIEVLKLALLFTAKHSDFNAVFVSIGESGSSDCTSSVLVALGEILTVMGVPHRVRTGTTSTPRGDLPTRGASQHRIDFLQRMRNEMLVPLLVHTERTYNQVVFLSDSLFCSSDVVRLLRHNNASIKCGMDYDTPGATPQFYDTWVAHDLTGRALFKPYPHLSVKHDQMKLALQKPVQVSCCWNGLTILEASAFVGSGLRFRRSVIGNGEECHAAETELICHDFAALGRPNLLMDPRVRLAYDRPTHAKLSARRTCFSDSLESASTVDTWSPLPLTYQCTDLDGNTGRSPRGLRHWAWYDFYRRHGVPVAISRNHSTLHECGSAYASSCKLSRGRRVPMSLHPEQVANTSQLISRPPTSVPARVIRQHLPAQPPADIAKSLQQARVIHQRPPARPYADIARVIHQRPPARPFAGIAKFPQQSRQATWDRAKAPTRATARLENPLRKAGPPAGSSTVSIKRPILRVSRPGTLPLPKD